MMTQDQARKAIKAEDGFSFCRRHMFCPLVREFSIVEGYENGAPYQWRYHHYYIFGLRVARIRVNVR